MRALLLVACLLVAGCASSYGGSIRLHPAPPGSNAVASLTDEQFQRLSAPLRGGIEAAHDGRNVTLDLSPADLDAARTILGCAGASVFSYRGALIACENDRVA